MSDTSHPADRDEPRDLESADVAPEEELLEGWLPEAEPTDGPAPAP
ncbi:hypothetical protein [Agromyces sp. LHK192]|nr:hypothetical protein [Agromyces sp. LHK192]